VLIVNEIYRNFNQPGRSQGGSSSAASSVPSRPGVAPPLVFIFLVNLSADYQHIGLDLIVHVQNGGDFDNVPVKRVILRCSGGAVSSAVESDILLQRAMSCW